MKNFIEDEEEEVIFLKKIFILGFASFRLNDFFFFSCENQIESNIESIQESLRMNESNPTVRPTIDLISRGTIPERIEIRAREISKNSKALL